MAKTSKVFARVELEIKEQAEGGGINSVFLYQMQSVCF